MPQFYTTAYLASDGYEAQLVAELSAAGITVMRRHHRLFLTDGPAVRSVWAANVWHEATTTAIASIGHAGAELKRRQRNWATYAPEHAGRSRLVAERLPYMSTKPLVLGAPAPTAPLGSWTLLTPSEMLAAERCDSPFPNGEMSLTEDRVGPPSRAYLKLWESFVRLGRFPGPGDSCTDLGASPGGWTWLLATLGATVTAIDKAPLAPTVASLPGVEWQQGSAFAIEPTAVDYLVCDVIAYPKRTMALIERWLPFVGAMVCTVKFQGETDHAAIAGLNAIQRGRVVHLHHNKHEVTFLYAR